MTETREKAGCAYIIGPLQRTIFPDNYGEYAIRIVGLAQTYPFSAASTAAAPCLCPRDFSVVANGFGRLEGLKNSKRGG